jgi:hypothetical protein
MQKNGNFQNDSDIIVYEPMRRNEKTEYINTKPEIRTANYSGLYNRGNKIL